MLGRNAQAELDQFAIGGRIAVGPNADDTDGFLCAVVKNARVQNSKLACDIFEALLERLPDGTFPPGGDDSDLPLPGASSSSRLGGTAPATSLRELLGGRS